jgi:iron(III) transport system substrate-binding protein
MILYSVLALFLFNEKRGQIHYYFLPAPKGNFSFRRQREEGLRMFRDCKFLVVILTVGFLMGTFNVVQGKGLPADVQKWLKKNKIGPFTEDKVDYDALYQAAKKEGKVVVYAHTSRGPKSLALGFYDKYPGIKVEWNNLGTSATISRVIKEQKAGIHTVDVVTATGFPIQESVMRPANMLFPWVPPDLKKVIPRKYRDPLLVWYLTAQVLFYNIDTWPDKPPIEGWWDVTRPEWKGRLVIPDPRTNTSTRQFFTTVVLNPEEMAKDYQRVFGKPLKLTTPNAGYEWIKMVFANKPKFVRNPKEARFIGKPGQAKPSLGFTFEMPRVTDSGNPKYGNIQWSPHVTLKPRMGMSYPATINIAYKAPRPNAAKLLIRWLFGNEKGKSGYTPWHVPGHLPVRADIKEPTVHPFNPKLSWPYEALNFWYMDAGGIWKKQGEVVEFINKQL